MGIESAANALAVLGSEDAGSRVFQDWCVTEDCAAFAHPSWMISAMTRRHLQEAQRADKVVAIASRCRPRSDSEFGHVWAHV
jgi:hypothetical protein